MAYSVPVGAIVAFLVILTPLADSPHVDGWGLGMFGVAELAVLRLVSLGVLPGTNPAAVQAVSEGMLASATTAASLLTLLLAGQSQEGLIIHRVLNGALLLAVLVYFCTKSAVSGQPRWAVLLVGIAPALQLYGAAL